MSFSAGARHLFVAQTTLQLMLSAAQASHLQHQGGVCDLLLIPDFKNPDLIRQALSRWNASPFQRVEFAEPRVAPGLERHARPEWSDVVRTIHQAVDRAELEAVYVFNDRQDVGQAVLIRTAQQCPQARRRCIEDGAQAYSNFVYRQAGWFRVLRRRRRCGGQWADIRVLGTHPLVQEFLAIYPDLVRDALQSRVYPMAAGALASPAMIEFATLIASACGYVHVSNPGGNSAVLALSHSSYAARNPAYAASVQAAAKALVGAGVSVAYKYHPRETDTDYLKIVALGGETREVPRELPIECVYLLYGKAAVLLIGGMSTTLLTGGLMLPNVSLLGIAQANESQDAWSAQMLDRIGLQVTQDQSELLTSIQRWITNSASDSVVERADAPGRS